MQWLASGASRTRTTWSPSIALYLYCRSFFLADKPVPNEHQIAIDYWLGQSKKYWLKLANRQSQAYIAVVAKASAIMPLPPTS